MTTDLTNELTIVAVPSAGCISGNHHIQLVLFGPSVSQATVEKQYPYTLFGDGGNVLDGGPLGAGVYVMQAYPIGLEENRLETSFSLESP